MMLNIRFYYTRSVISPIWFGLHAGPRTTQSLILKTYWIISLRSVLHCQIHNCVKCLRFSASPLQPLMADLPPSRFQTVRAFQSAGIDFAVSFSAKLNSTRNARSTKGYLALFVCKTTKAVHFELVSELNIASLLAAFNRFASRRGLHHDVYSVNGTTFVGAARH